MGQLGEILAGSEFDAGNAAFEPGDMLFWPSDQLPDGWAWCDGTPKSRTGATAALFAAIGTDHGAGDGSTTFNVPDMRERMPAGANVDAGGGSGGQIGHSHAAGSLAQKNHTHPSRGSLYAPSHGHGHTLGSPSHTHTRGFDMFTIGGSGSNLNYKTQPDNAAGALNGGIGGSGDLAAAGTTGSAGAAGLTGSTDTADPPHVVVNFVVKL